MIWLSCILVFGRLEGWYYFDEAKSSLDPEEAEAVLQLERERHQNLLALALMEPTRENIANYIEEHKRVNEASVRFAKSWSDIVEQGHFDPALSERYFLLFVFKEEPGNKAQIAKEFAARRHWNLKGLSLDGSKLNGIECEQDAGLGALLPCFETPSFYAIDPVKNIVIPLGSDIASIEELEERILNRCEL